MNILVTGGAGYIGTSLVEKLNASPDVNAIYVYDNLTNSSLSFFMGGQKLSKVTFRKEDILNSYALDEVLNKVEVVFHLAAYVSLPYNYAQNAQYEQINKWGTLNLVRCIRQSHHQVKQFIYLSSASVYGLHGEVDIKETPNPSNAYGKSKLEGEKYARLLENQCKVNIIRSANVFGFNSGFREDSVLNHFIFNGLVTNKILVYGDGSQKRPFVSLDHVVDKLIATLGDEDKTENYAYAMDFNSDLNTIKDWLIQNHLPDLEYTYVNRNIEYKQQSIKGLSRLKDVEDDLDQEFSKFQQRIRIQQG
jgi:UDP-glucose 4-epimerase